MKDAGERPFGFLNRYWNDAAFREEADAERERERAKCHAAINAGMAAANERQRAEWAKEDSK